MAYTTFGSFSLDTGRDLLFRDGEAVTISHKGLLLLKALVGAEGRPVSKQELMDLVWPSVSVGENNLSVQIAGLRQILGECPSGGSWIVTIPRGGYRFLSAPSGSAPLPAEPVKRPSILVLPFVNVSGDKTQDYLSDGITEDVIIALSKYRWFSVVPRSSSFLATRGDRSIELVAAEHQISHLVEGSLRRDGNRIRITARLSAHPGGAQTWGERYDLEMEDVFAVQDEIAERIAGAVEPELLRAAPAVLMHTGNITAWDLVRQGTFRFHQLRWESHLEAREYFRRAAALDPRLAEAQLWIARVNAGLVAYGWSDDPAKDLGEGREAGRRAVEIDERNPYAHYGLAIVSAYGGHLDEAQRAAEHAIELAPSFALGHLVLGLSRLFAGNAQSAVTPLEYGLHLSPHDPQNFVWYGLLALAQLFAGSTTLAQENALRALKIRPGWRTTLEILAACSETIGHDREADAYRRDYDASMPVSGDVLAPMRERNPSWAKRLSKAVESS